MSKAASVVAMFAIAVAIICLVIAAPKASAPAKESTLVLNLRQGLATSSMIVGGMSTQACEREALRWIAHGTAPGVSTAFAHCVNSND
ncbi:hypothetical protein UFOVP1433_38 [uncultured Caudovirales phage]|uniref:Uncharacterized protein n=1 Tax=uncultured Caudovirales phage TaxID=2100421 RepID=A0A6J5QQ80_9CAUD|nr:hypothetical protein UFOVP553_38 [uncultured Caudovirales phage]CAB4183118.1 hypothetical protein UFOVP1081_38 [uncultured Caudovirales phage]CAB4212973.1 hypothetical protein UFOVP1433_38 [uncultured Caudovirales phage]